MSALLHDIARAMNGRVSGDRAIFPTPGHSARDRGSWASLAPGAPDGVVIHSANGGDALAIKDELRAKGVLGEREFARRPEPMFRQPRNPGVSHFEFCSAGGEVVCRKVRTDLANGEKTFTWQHPDGKGGWASGRGCDALLYRLPELLSAPTDAVVYVAEGERKADHLAKWGFVATSSKDLPDDLSAFEGRTVVILPDNDDQGATIADKLQAALSGIAAKVVQIKLPGLPPKGDIIDWAGNGRSAFELQALVDLALAPDLLPTLDLAALSLVRAQPKQFAIERLAPLGEVTLFTGAGSAGKSLLAQQLATAAAAGTTCLRIGVAPTPAIYATCEDDPEQLHWRQQHICEAMRVPMADLSGRLHLISLRGALDNELGRFAHDGTMTLAPAYHRLVATIRATGSNLVFLDNVAHLFTGNENDRGQVTRFLNLLNRLASETGAAIVLLGHPPKPSKPGEKTHQTSGSTAWVNGVRSQFYIEHDLTTDIRTLFVGKANYAQKGDSARFVWQDWAFVHEDDLPQDVREQMAETIQAIGDNKLFLTCLAERNKQRRQVSEKPTAQNFAPKIFEGMPEAKGLTRQRLNSAMDRLFRINAIERTLLWRQDGKDIFGLGEVSPDGTANPGNLAGNLPETYAGNLRKPAENDRKHPPYTYGISGAATGSATPDDHEDDDDFLSWVK